jgi:signal transduction histidine kinase
MLGLLQLDAGDAGPTGPEPPSPGIEELQTLVDRARAAGVPVEADLPAVEETLPAGLALAVHRIVQESLTNVVRHAPGAACTVTVRLEEDAVDVRVANRPSARGAVPHGDGDGSGRGLIGMRERVGMYGGRLVAAPSGDGGFEVHAVIPVSAEETAEAAR